MFINGIERIDLEEGDYLVLEDTPDGLTVATQHVTVCDAVASMAESGNPAALLVKAVSIEIAETERGEEGGR